MTACALFVPIHLDALVLAKPDLFVGPSAHFARLPHMWQGTDVNPDVPNLGKSVVAPPFQDRSFLLGAGVHLHWALPDGLTRAQHVKDGDSKPAGPGSGFIHSGGFPAVPNRWLVVRRHEIAGHWVADQTWVVESDYLWPSDHDSDNHVSVPSAWTDPESGRPAKRPFRRIGRQGAGEQYSAGLDGNSHLARPLTAMGYGEPTFATVYQNCHSVFGLHDTCVPTTDTRYEVFGWYGDPDHDPLRCVLQSEKDDAARTEAVASRFGWRVSKTEKIPANAETVCFVSLTISAKREEKPRSGKVELAYGNTASEALSAHLARKMAGQACRDSLEDQLESVLLGPRLSGKQLDRAARLADARHEKGYVATFGGWIWTVKSQEPPEHRLQDAKMQGEDAAPVDSELAARLAKLNGLQREHDRAVLDVEAARGQLFADWCKYMQVVYPSFVTWQDHETFDGDGLRVFIEQQADAVEALVRAKQGATVDALEKARQSVADRVAEINKNGPKGKAKQLALQTIPGPRFYRPTEPVVLIHGDAVRATERHGQDGREDEDDMLRCDLSTAALLSAARVPDAEALCAQLDRLRADSATGKSQADRIGFCTWEQPWHPVLLEWEVELFPIKRGDLSGGENYPPNHITDHYSLPVNAAELTSTQVLSGDPKHGNFYQGSSMLTPHARLQHEAALRAYVVEHCGCSGEQLKKNRAMVEAEYRAKLSLHGQTADDPVSTALRALGEIDEKEYLSQALTGINDAFLGLHQSYQLPIGDPIGFASEQDLAQRVRDLVLSFNRSAPDEAGGFDPIRAGWLIVRKLRLVDTFGQILDLDVKNAVKSVSRSLRQSDDDSTMFLPARFVQPARVNLRWLATAHSTAETGTTSASSPVCGWLIVDNLDSSLWVHDANGRALGVISSGSETGLWQAGWQAAPGNDAATQVWNIDDPHLRRVAEWFVEHSGPQVWDRILEKIETALGNIDPEGSAHHEDLAVLMGQPLAVTRAELSVSLAGPPALHQGVDAFFKDVMTGGRRTDRFEDVMVPVRLGAHERANDGLVAYWRETPKGLSAEALWPQSDELAPVLVAPSSHQTPVTLTMLVDPLAEVHATSGVLPPKSITIPASLYAAELKRLEISFRSLGPILTRIGRLDLPLPAEPGYAWSWIERDDCGWSVVAGDIGASQDDGAFSGPIVAREGWMRLTKVESPEPDSSDNESTDANLR